MHLRHFFLGIKLKSDSDYRSWSCSIKAGEGYILRGDANTVNDSKAVDPLDVLGVLVQG